MKFIINQVFSNYKETIFYLHTNFNNIIGCTKTVVKKYNTIDGDFIGHKCITECGYSGSPIICNTTSCLGIHCGGYNDDFNRICYLGPLQTAFVNDYIKTMYYKIWCKVSIKVQPNTLKKHYSEQISQLQT